jgi:hypothetical protein
VTAGPGNEMAAGAGGHGRLRASHADRQQVIDVLKDAFVQGMLDNDQLDARVGQAFASRTYAELAALTADIPARSAATGPVPASAAARTLAKAARRSGVCVLIAFALVGVVALTNAENLAGPAFVFGIVAVIAASGFWGTGWSTPGKSGAPAGSCRRGRAGTAEGWSADGPAAAAVIGLRPEPAAARTGPTYGRVAHARADRALPGEVPRHRIVCGLYRVPCNTAPRPSGPAPPRTAHAIWVPHDPGITPRGGCHQSCNSRH